MDKILKEGRDVFVQEHFKELNLSNEKISTKEFDDCTFIGCNFSEATFYRCKFTECTFKNCNLSMVKVKSSAFFDVVFEESKVIGVNWTEAAWPTIKLSCPLKFYQCILNDSSFMGLSIREIIMIECKAHDIDLREADCTEADFGHTDFTNGLFNKTQLNKANFREATNYNINIFSNELKQAKFTLPEATNLLRSLDIEIDD